MNRRTFLTSAGLGVIAGAAGCLEDPAAGDELTTPAEEDNESDSSGDDDEGDGGEQPDTSEVVGQDVFQVAVHTSTPEWREDDDTAVGTVERFDTEADARDELPLEEVDEDRRDAVDTFIADTDFENALLLYVASVGPNACYDTIDVSDLAVDDSTLVGEVMAKDTSEDEAMCAEVVTYPSALVRVTFDGEKPDSVVLTVVDGWGNEAEIEATADERDDSEQPDSPAVSDQDTMQFAAYMSSPEWRENDDTAVGTVERYDTEANARDELDLEAVDEERRDEVDAFIAETNFESALLLYIASVGPNTCYETIEVSDLTIENATLVGEARAVDTSGDNEVCGQAVTFPSALVRVVFDGEKPADIVLTIVDGWGNEDGIEAPTA